MEERLRLSSVVLLPYVAGLDTVFRGRWQMV